MPGLEVKGRAEDYMLNSLPPGKLERQVTPALASSLSYQHFDVSCRVKILTWEINWLCIFE